MPMKMEQTECSETSAYKIQTPGNHAKESIQHTEHGESLKLRNYLCIRIVGYEFFRRGYPDKFFLAFSSVVRQMPGYK